MATDGGFKSELARYLHVELAKRNLPYAEAARRSGLSHGAISNIISSGTARYDTLLKIANGVGLPIEELAALAGINPGGEPTVLGALRDDERRLLWEYNELSEADRAIALRLLSGLRLQAFQPA